MDPNRLQQVLWNLLSNAIKFTPKGGRVQVILERVNSQVEISVADNGIGISPELLPFVFERFRQADATMSRRFGGLGIGLSLVKHLVELHGGSVRVRSPEEGQGTTFSVALPTAHVDTEEKRLESHQRVNGVEGELPREVIARILRDRGAWAQCAESAGGALELLGHEQVCSISHAGLRSPLLRLLRMCGRRTGNVRCLPGSTCICPSRLSACLCKRSSV